MGGHAKKRVQDERAQHQQRRQGSSSGSTSTSSGRVSHSATSTSHATPTSRSRRDYDGNRDPEERAVVREPEERAIIRVTPNKNLDLPAVAYTLLDGQQMSLKPPPKPTRPSTLGSAIKVGLNTFHVSSLPSLDVYQYEVMIGNGAEKRGLINKVWHSKTVKAALPAGTGFIFDGNRLAWALRKVDREVRATVDLDAEEGRKPGKKPNVHKIHIRFTNKVPFQSLQAYLSHTASFDNAVLEAINFLDHLLRETPSTRYTAIKRNFFDTDLRHRFPLGSGVEAYKGVYQSMRIVHNGPAACLSVNVDVANGTFWTTARLTEAVQQLVNARDMSDLVRQLQQSGEKGRAGIQLKKMRKLHVYAKHRGQKDTFVIEKFVWTTARDYKFEKDGSMISIYDYFKSQYNYRINFPDLPLVKATKGKNTLLPMEILYIAPNERYAFKLDERQTSNMIKFAVTPPPERWQAVQHGLRMLDWQNDPLLRQYKLQISTSQTVVNGRLLQAPTVKFGSGEARPGTSGRWDLKQKKFLSPNTAPLKSWSVCVVGGRRGGKPDKSTIEKFISQFVSTYQSHGGRVENKNPVMSLSSGDDVAKWVTDAWNAAGNQVQARPQILVFILPDKDSTVYGRIKRSAECRYGVVSQCMQYAHVQKCQGQYISNVCMKFNAKLGGITARATGPKSSGATGLFTVPTMVIGADVSHAAPGAQIASMAAITVSLDKLATRYAAVCQTNGFRVEMITADTINNDLKPLVQDWCQNIGQGKMPQRVIFFRDGVSEGQYKHVLEQEVSDMKEMFKQADPGSKVQFVVIVGSKRHHVRFFPENGDRNKNPLPGTLVETGVTHPFENDFYLCSHAAIKGTARPMHYYVLLNEAGMSNDEIQTLIYEQSYQYIRATTPVSQHPAMYYAHIASGRAVTHDPSWTGSSSESSTTQTRPQSGSQGSPHRSGSSSGMIGDVKKLMPMPNQGKIATSMWYI